MRRVLREARSARDAERIVSEVLIEYFGDGYAVGHADISEHIWREVQRAKGDSELPDATLELF